MAFTNLTFPGLSPKGPRRTTVVLIGENHLRDSYAKAHAFQWSKDNGVPLLMEYPMFVTREPLYHKPTWLDPDIIPLEQSAPHNVATYILFALRNCIAKEAVTNNRLANDQYYNGLGAKYEGVNAAGAFKNNAFCIVATAGYVVEATAEEGRSELIKGIVDAIGGDDKAVFSTTNILTEKDQRFAGWHLEGGGYAECIARLRKLYTLLVGQDDDVTSLFDCAAGLNIANSIRFHSFLFALDFDDIAETAHQERFANLLDVMYSTSFGAQNVRDISHRITVTERDTLFADIIEKTARGNQLVVAEMGAAHCDGVARQLRVQGMQVFNCSPGDIRALDQLVYEG